MQLVYVDARALAGAELVCRRSLRRQLWLLAATVVLGGGFLVFTFTAREFDPRGPFAGVALLVFAAVQCVTLWKAMHLPSWLVASLGDRLFIRFRWDVDATSARTGEPQAIDLPMDEIASLGHAEENVTMWTTDGEGHRTSVTRRVRFLDIHTRVGDLDPVRERVEHDGDRPPSSLPSDPPVSFVGDRTIRVNWTDIVPGLDRVLDLLGRSLPIDGSGQAAR